MPEAPAIIQAKAVWEQPKKKLEASLAKGRRRGSVAGSYIADLVGLGKAIILCKAKCQSKFNAAGSGYVLYQEVTGYDYHRGRCDDCREFTKCNTFLPKNLTRT